MITLYHNNRCSKSREALALLQEQGHQVNVVHYLTQPPTVEELRSVLTKLQLDPFDVVRKGETLYKEKYANLSLSPEEWLHVLVENPVLLERPIAVNGDKAAIGRPLENIKAIL